MPEGKPIDRKYNDGTIFVSDNISQPVQGTYYGTNADGQAVLDKGIARPTLYCPYTHEREEVTYVSADAFGHSMEGSSGYFSQLGELGPQRMRLGLQAVMFNFAHPDAIMQKDTDRIRGKSVSAFLDEEGLRKYKAGIPLALLLDPLAMWARVGQISVPGIRAVAYASDLVPATPEDGVPIFKLLPDSGLRLMKQVRRRREANVKCVDDMVGMTFVIHRDPALPDASCMFRARFGGVLEWTNECKNKHGVVMNPACKKWKGAGGDFDGDTAGVIDFPDEEKFQLRPTLARTSWKTGGTKYVSSGIAGQMLEAAGDEAVGLLGPLVIAAMCLLERDAADDSMLALVASAIQASVEAKKHAVDTQRVVNTYQQIGGYVRALSNDGAMPFLIRGFNEINNASGVAAKLEAWSNIKTTADNLADRSSLSSIEAALLDRVRALTEAFEATEFARQERRASMPSALRNAARAACDKEVGKRVEAMTKRYVEAVADREAGGLHVDDDPADPVEDPLAAKVRQLRDQFALACITGNVNGVAGSIEQAQIAVLGYGPIRIAAREVPAEIIERFAAPVEMVAISLIGKWEDGVYSLKDLNPVPNCKSDLRLLDREISGQQVDVLVQGYAERNGEITSTRAHVYRSIKSKVMI